MARSSAAQQLEQDYYRESFKPQVTEWVIDVLTLVKDRVMQRLFALNTRVARKAEDVNSYIERKRLKQSDVEGNIRDHRLKEALRVKRNLEQKLTQVEQSIEKLGSDEPASPFRVDLRDSKVRRQFYSEESARRQEATELAQKLRKEQVEIMRRQQERQREMDRKFKDEDLEAQKTREEQAQRKQEDKEKHVAEIKESIRKRRKAMEMQRQLEATEQERVKGQKYVDEKLLHDFHKRVLLPQEEQRAELITKVKLLHKPISKDEIEEHARRHDEEVRQLRSLREAERKSRLPEPLSTRTSTFTQSILLQARKDSEEKEALESEKRALQVKRKHYAELVKSLFVPAVDVFKQKEMELMKERLKAHSVASRTHREPVSPFRPHKFKPNSMVPHQKERKQSDVADYLADRRKVRDVLDLGEMADDGLFGAIKAKLNVIDSAKD